MEGTDAHPAASRVDRSVYRGKRLGIMQPYFFPYLGYFGLIAVTDRWIVFDPVQYIRKGWMNRNRVLKAGGGEKFVGVTVAPHERGTLIKDMRLQPDTGRADHFIRQLDHYKLVRAPHYRMVLDLLLECFNTDQERLAPFLTRTLAITCDYLGIPFNHETWSEMGLTHAQPDDPADWSLFTCMELGATTYVNPPGGRAFFDPRRFAAHGVKLLYHEQQLPPYDQRGTVFVPGLSIIDAMMFCSPREIRDMLKLHALSEA